MSFRQQYLQVAINTPVDTAFDYLPPIDQRGEQLSPGMRVAVPFGKKDQAVGIVLGYRAQSTITREKLRHAHYPLDDTPVLDTKHLALLRWASSYYHYPIGQTIFQMLPRALQKAKRYTGLSTNTVLKTPRQSSGNHRISLNLAQQQALETILQPREKWQPFLLYGVTGSGKTEVYLRVIDQALRENRQALVMLPEISLTQQTLSHFRAFFHHYRIVVMHSGCPAKERLLAWQQARSGAADIIIGTRSAIWLPLARSGIYIVDEEHDPSYKQQSGFLYSARDVALFRAQKEEAIIVLGSATPSLETLHRNLYKGHLRVTMPQRVRPSAKTRYSLIDLRAETMHGAVSQHLRQAMEQELQNGNQVLLFRNRRGYATRMLCHHCGNKLHCTRCERPYTWHKQSSRLICHHCGQSERKPMQCAHCHSQSLLAVGHGTERIEETLTRLFPKQVIVRLDRDTVRHKGDMETQLRKIATGQADIIIGTQMLAKGHHFPHITLSGIIDADAGLFSKDYRASERLAQLLIQVGGRSGRGNKPGQVQIQTHFPEHPVLQTMLRYGYWTMAKQLLKERQQANLPPYSFHALLRGEAKKQEVLQQFMEHAYAILPLQAEHDVTSAYGPMNAPIEKRGGWYRMQILLQSSQRRGLHQLITSWLAALDSSPFRRRVRWAIDIDPQDIT